MKTFLYIEQTEFLRSMMEFALKAKGARVYTVSTLENNFYLLDDLMPCLVIFDVQSVGTHLEELCQRIPKEQLIAVGDESERPAVVGKVREFFARPLEAKNLATRFLSFTD